MCQNLIFHVCVGMFFFILENPNEIVPTFRNEVTLLLASLKILNTYFQKLEAKFFIQIICNNNKKITLSALVATATPNAGLLLLDGAYKVL